MRRKVYKMDWSHEGATLAGGHCYLEDSPGRYSKQRGALVQRIRRKKRKKMMMMMKKRKKKKVYKR